MEQENERVDKRRVGAGSGQWLRWVAEGYLKGVEKAGYKVNLAPGQVFEILQTGGEVPDEVWDELNSGKCKDQAIAIDEMVCHVYTQEALDAVQQNDAPFGTLEGGEEYLALPPRLAGRGRYFEIFVELMPYLPKLGLDQGSIWGKTGQVEYPSVKNLFYDYRGQFYQEYDLGNYDRMMDVIMHLEDEIGWPHPLAKLFRSPVVAMNMIGQVATHF